MPAYRPGGNLMVKVVTIFEGISRSGCHLTKASSAFSTPIRAGRRGNRCTVITTLRQRPHRRYLRPSWLGDEVLTIIGAGAGPRHT